MSAQIKDGGPGDVLAVMRHDATLADAYRIEEGISKIAYAAAAERSSAALAAVAELIAAAKSAKNALAIIAGAEESDTSDKLCQLLFDDLPRLRAALANVGPQS